MHLHADTERRPVSAMQLQQVLGCGDDQRRPDDVLNFGTRYAFGPDRLMGRLGLARAAIVQLRALKFFCNQVNELLQIAVSRSDRRRGSARATLGLRDRDAFAARVVRDLVAADLADAEIRALRVAEVEAADG